MTDTVTYQNIYFSCWIALYNDMITVVAVRIYVQYFPLRNTADEQNWGASVYINKLWHSALN